MNYLWEVILQLKKRGLEEGQVRFKMAGRHSPYLELSSVCLNEEEVEAGAEIEVNPYIRFYEIFHDMYLPQVQEFSNLRQSLTNLILHILAGNDALSGMSRQQYLKKLLLYDFAEGVYGEWDQQGLMRFSDEEREIILGGILRQYRTGSSLTLFEEMVHTLTRESIVYRSNERPAEIMIYIGERYSRGLEERVCFLVRMFLEISFHAETFYEYHFGILGVDETMIMDETVMCR